MGNTKRRGGCPAGVLSGSSCMRQDCGPRPTSIVAKLKEGQSASPPVRQSASPPVRQSASPPVRQSASPPVRQSASPPVRSPPVRQSASPPVRQSASPPVRQSASPPVRQSASKAESGAFAVARAFSLSLFPSFHSCGSRQASSGLAPGGCGMAAGAPRSATGVGFDSVFAGASGLRRAAAGNSEQVVNHFRRGSPCIFDSTLFFKTLTVTEKTKFL